VRSGVVKLVLLGLPFLTACTGDENGPPVAHAADFETLEDTPAAGQVTGADPEGQPLSFEVVSAQHGRVTSLSSNGAFTFEPEADFHGTAAFVFSVTDNAGQTAEATASLLVESVNDPPRLSAVPDLTNSAEAEVLRHQLTVVDPDLDEHAFSLSIEDPSIVEASVDMQQGQVSLKALRPGSTIIEVTVADAEYSDTAEFRFSANEVTKSRAFRYAETMTGAVVLRNEADRSIDFVLEHNGFPVFEDVDSMVEYVRAMPSEYAGEEFARKLWRFLRDSVYHDVPPTTTLSYYDPWLTINSLGWGLCGHVAGAYKVIAQAAGFEARVWGLNGHVVPEIRVDGEWRMYDPDLAVYYKAADGRVVGVEELAANPTLITDPVDAIFAGSSNQYPYSQPVAALYSSTNDNQVGWHIFLPPGSAPAARVSLPPHATLTYPGRWTVAPTGWDGSTPYAVRSYRQASLDIQDGWTGQVAFPWFVWDISGAGRVEVDHVMYDIGSSALMGRLRDTPFPVSSLYVHSNSDVRVTLLVNAVRLKIEPETRVAISGLDVWAVAMSQATLGPMFGGGGPLEESLRKPLPTTLH
jgi:hypothetical protein